MFSVLSILMVLYKLFFRNLPTTPLLSYENKLAKLRRHTSRVHFAKLDFGKIHIGTVHWGIIHFEKIHLGKIHVGKILFGNTH